MNVKEIVEKYLKENGYDGLTSEHCGCGINDMNWCAESIFECEAAYKKECFVDGENQCHDCEMTTDIKEPICENYPAGKGDVMFIAGKRKEKKR